MAKKEFSQFSLNRSSILKDVPEFVINWFNEKANDAHDEVDDPELRKLKIGELEDLKKLLTDGEAIFFWRWIKPKSKLIKTDNILNFLNAAVKLKYTARDIRRKFNAKKYYQTQIADLKSIDTSLKKINLSGKINMFSNNDLRFSVILPQESSLFKKIDRQKMIGLSEKEFAQTLAIHVDILRKLINGKINLYKNLEKKSKGPGKINDPNAEAIYYVHQLIVQFQAFLVKEISPKIVADITNLLMSPNPIMDESHVSNILNRSVSKKKI